MYREIKKDEIDFVMCDFNIINFQNECSDIVVNNEYSIEIMDKNQAFVRCYPFNGYVWKGLFVVEKLKNIYFDTTMYIAEDLFFIIKYIANCEKDIVYIQEKLYNYVTREGSAVLQKNTSDSKVLKRQIDMLNTLKYTEKIIIENCENMETIKKIEREMVTYYWMIIYPIISKKLLNNNEIQKKYYNELKEYRQYFSKKDKFYIMLLRINPRIFAFVYGSIKEMKKMLKRK